MSKNNRDKEETHIILYQGLHYYEVAIWSNYIVKTFDGFVKFFEENPKLTYVYDSVHGFVGLWKSKGRSGVAKLIGSKKLTNYQQSLEKINKNEIKPE